MKIIVFEGLDKSGKHTASLDFENKLKAILSGWSAGLISDDTAIEYLYGKSWTDDKKRKEVKWIIDNRDKSAQAPFEQGDFGMLGADNSYNEEHKKPEI